MPFKGKRSGSTGRPKGPGKADVKNMGDDERKEYFRMAKQKERSAACVPKETFPSKTPTTPSGKSTTRSGTVYSPSNKETSAPKSVGRPPLDDHAMTPNTLKMRKRKLYHAKEQEKQDADKQREISSARSAAAHVRWNNRLDSTDVSENADSSSTAEVAPTDTARMEETNMEESISEANQESNSFISESSDLQVIIQPSARTVLRAKSKLIPVMPKNMFDGLQIFKRCYLKIGKHEQLKIQLQAANINEGAMSKGQVQYRYNKIMKIFDRHKNCHDVLFQTWLEHITALPTLERFMDQNHLQIPDSILPRSFSLSRIVQSEMQKLLSCSFKSGANSACKTVGTQLVVEVAKAGNLSADHHGDVSLLANAVSCGRMFAKKVLQAVHDGEEESLYERNIRCDSLLASDWPKKLEQFVLEPENSRAVPGQDNISIRYGQRVPKYLLLKSKDEIIKQFKTQHPACKFSVSTLMREFPPYAVQPTSRDIERNSCPIHANARRLVKAINKVLRKNKKPTLPTSCKQLSLRSMCNNGSQTIDPLSWTKECAVSECESCPVLNVDIDDAQLSSPINLSQWRSKKQDKKDKKTGEMVTKYVFALYPESMTLKETIIRLQESLPAVRKHVYTSHCQWHAHKTYRENLDESSIITVEDYQMNIEPEYIEAPCSLSYSTNKVTFALYPVCIEYMEDGKLKKGAVSFITDDTKHDHQQVQRFEERLFEIVREKIRPGIVNWFRFSDGCGGQFKSRKCVADLFNDVEKFQLKQAGFHLFESHEGTSASDSIGSWVKCAIRRGMLKDENIVIKTADDVVNLARSEVRDKTDKYSFSIIEAFDAFERSTDQDELVIEGITQLHSFIVQGDNLYFRAESCTKCRVSEMCETCAATPDADRSYIKRADLDEDEVEDAAERHVHDDEDDGKTYDDSDEEEEERES